MSAPQEIQYEAEKTTMEERVEHIGTLCVKEACTLQQLEILTKGYAIEEDPERKRRFGLSIDAIKKELLQYNCDITSLFMEARKVNESMFYKVMKKDFYYFRDRYLASETQKFYRKYEFLYEEEIIKNMAMEISLNMISLNANMAQLKGKSPTRPVSEIEEDNRRLAARIKDLTLQAIEICPNFKDEYLDKIHQENVAFYTRSVMTPEEPGTDEETPKEEPKN